MSISNDIINLEVQMTANKAMAELNKLESETADLRKENERMAITRAKLKALGKEETEDFKKLSAAMDVNRKKIKENESSMAAFRRTIGVTAMSMTDLRKRANELRGQLDGTSKAANPKEYARLERELGRVHNQMNNLGAGTNRTGRILTGLKALMPALGIAAVGAALKSVITSIIQVRSEFERYAAVLKNTLGSAQAARMEMAMLKQFAASTPFELNQLTGAFVKLVNQGFKPNREEMRKLGDLASSTGKDFDMLAEAIIDAQVGEFERLKEFGIRAEKHGDQVKFTFKGISTEVDFTAQSIQKYMLSLGDMEGVSGAMEEIMGTLGGRISNLKDTWTNFIDTLGGKTSGIFATVIGWLTKFVTWITEATYSLKQIKEMVLDDLTKQNLQSSIEEINTMATSLMKNGLKQKEAYDRALVLYNQSREQQINQLKASIEEATGTEKEGLEKRLTLLQAEKEAVKNHYMELAKLQKGGGSGKDSSKQMEQAIEEAYQARMLKIEANYAAERITKERHDAEMLSEELAYIQAQIALKQRLGDTTIELELKYQEKLASVSQESRKLYQDLVKENEKSYEEMGKMADDWFDKMIVQDQALADRKVEIEKQTTDTIQKIRQADLNNEQLVLQEKAQLYQNLINDLSGAVYSFASDQEDGMNEFLKTVINMALDLLKAQVEIAIAGVTIQSLASAESVATYGVAGLAKAALLVGLIEAAFAGVKGLVNTGLSSGSKKKNLWDGGYTATGRWDQPQGVVHSDEFVANRHAVRNPQVRPILDVIDMAQRSGQIGSLNSDAIFRAVESRRLGYASGGYTPKIQEGTVQMASVDPEMKALIAQNSLIMNALNERLKYPLEADISYQKFKKRTSEMEEIVNRTTIS